MEAGHHGVFGLTVRPAADLEFVYVNVNVQNLHPGMEETNVRARIEKIKHATLRTVIVGS